MPLNVQKDLPALGLLRQEKIFVEDEARHGLVAGLRPLRVLVLNLMPMKEVTEADLLRLLSHTPLPVKLDFLKLKTHTPKHVSAEHMERFYLDFESVEEGRYDGLIVTGAPVEKLPFEEVHYWEELRHIFDWARLHVTSTLYICWAAQAALYYFYGIPKYPLPQKMFGIFRHTLLEPSLPIFRGFDEAFFVPHSRHTEIRREDILQVPALRLLSESEEAGVYMVMSRGGREFYLTGHSEYAPDALDGEYRRDLAKGLPIGLPKHYYRDDDPAKGPLVRWRAHANLLFSNWLQYYVGRPAPACDEDICLSDDLR
jgi:homoserine O-succinyltransferase